MCFQFTETDIVYYILAHMATHLKKHWKKYAIGTLLVGLGTSYLAKRLRDNNVIREYCNEAKKYGEERTSLYQRPRKLMVFLNPKANNTQAKVHFMKYAAPLFHLSGMDVTVVESDYEGQIRTLMGYIDPKTDGIIVAGGDGTLMEVVNGLMRRRDVNLTGSIPIGVLPLGKENRFYQLCGSARSSFNTPARCIGEATMDIIKGNVTSIHMMELQPENGKTLYAMSSVQWGAFKEATENRDRFRLFGRLRTFFSYLNTALRRWPLDYQLHVWLPATALAVDSSNHPPGERRERPPDCLRTSEDEDKTHVTSRKTSGVTFKALFLPHAQCAGRHLSSSSSSQDEKPGSTRTSSSSSQDEKPGSTRTTSLLSQTGSSPSITSLARGVEGDPQWRHKIFDVVGAELSLVHAEDCLRLAVWSANTRKGDFIKQGWAESLRKPSPSLPCHTLQSSEFILQPHSHNESWLSIDGEPYEAMPVTVKMRPSTLKMFCSKTHA